MESAHRYFRIGAPLILEWTHQSTGICTWYQQAEKLESGEITKEEYDQWRYTYPKMEAEQTRQELDALREKRKAENNTD